MPGGQGAGDRREGEAAVELDGAQGAGGRREEEEGDGTEAAVVLNGAQEEDVGTEVAVVLHGVQGSGDRRRRALGQRQQRKGKGKEEGVEIEAAAGIKSCQQSSAVGKAAVQLYTCAGVATAKTTGLLWQLATPARQQLRCTAAAVS